MPKHLITQRILKKDLVKLFTNVPHDFIDDFYDILDNNNTEIFSVNLDIASKWLNVEKRVLTRTIR